MRKAYTEEEKKLIIKNYNNPNHSIKGLAKETNSTYGMVVRFLKKNNLEVSKEVIDYRKNKGRFNKGHVTHNKGKKLEEWMRPEMIEKIKGTQFKKGSLPHNYKTGEFISKDGYIIKTLGESKQQLKHIYNWEKVNGKLPKGHCLRCKDGNIRNCDPNNWELITREENMLLNSRHKPPKSLVRTMALNSKLKKQIQKLEENGK